MAYEEMSRDEAGGIFFRSPAQTQMAAPQPAPLAPQPAGQRPTAVKAAPSKPGKIETPDMVSDVTAAANQAKKEIPQPELISPIDTLVDEVISNWKPLAAAAGAGAAAAVGGELLRRSIRKKDMGGTAKPMERIEPTMAPEPPMAAPDVTAPAPAGEQRLTPQQAIERAKAVNAPVAPPVPGGPNYNVPTAAVPQIGVQAPAAATVQAPMGAVPPAPAVPSVTEAVVTGQSPAQAIKTDLAQQIDNTPAEQGIKKRAAKTQQTFKSPEKLPSDLSFRADLGPGDNWLFNTYGPEGRKAILGAFNEGKPAVSYERARELSQMVQEGRVGPAIPRDVAKERGIAPPETNYGKLGKAVKVAGTAGLALTAAQLAQAAQQARQGNMSPAAEAAFNLIGMIPGLSAAFNLGTYSPELGAGEQKELAKRRNKPATID